MSEPKSVKGNILTTQNHTNKSRYVKTFRAKLWLENEPWLRTEVMETKRHVKCETPSLSLHFQTSERFSTTNDRKAVYFINN